LSARQKEKTGLEAAQATLKKPLQQPVQKSTLILRC
jgi:hypothetical protein